MPSLDGTRKDHKRWAGPLGPPLRPMVNAKKGPNGNQGNLLARTVKPVKLDLIKQINTEVGSTEEILYHVEQHNQRVGQNQARRVQPPRGQKLPPIQTSARFIGSMDPVVWQNPLLITSGRLSVEPN